MLHPRGHVTSAGWTDMALDLFEAVAVPDRPAETR